MLAVYTLSSKKRNVLLDPNKNELTTYNQCQGTNLNHCGTVWRKGNIQNVKPDIENSVMYNFI